MISDTKKNSLGYDYLVFSKTDNCWEELHLNAVNLAISEIDAISGNLFYLWTVGSLFLSKFPCAGLLSLKTPTEEKNEYYFLVI